MSTTTDEPCAHNFTDDNGRPLNKAVLEQVREVKLVELSESAHQLQLRVDHDDIYSITMHQTCTDMSPQPWDLIYSVWDYESLYNYGFEWDVWFNPVEFRCKEASSVPKKIYDDKDENEFQDLKTSRTIEVFADAEITFNATRIRDGYKRSVSFTTSKGVEEEWIYRSHGTVIYFILSRTFDIKKIETAGKADDEDNPTPFTFTASDYPPKLMSNLVEVMDNMEVDDDFDYDQHAKYRPQIESMIKTPTLGWDAIKGDLGGAVEKGQRYVRAIGNDYTTKPPAGLLLYGPPGTGKTTLGEVIASQLGDKITFFNVPKDTIQKAAQLGALFAIAAERAPSVILFDEINTFMSKQHTAMVPVVTSSWKVTNPTGVQQKPLPYVLVIGTTNYVEKLDGAVLNRFGHDTTPKRSIEVGPPDDAARKAIFVDHLKNVKHNLTEEDFNTLIALMPDSVGRTIALLVADIASDVEDDFKNPVHDRVDEYISLADFQQKFKTEEAESTMAPESSHQFSCRARMLLMEDPNPGTSTEQKVISVKYMIEKMLSDANLQALGARNITKLRTGEKYLSENTDEKAFLNNLLICLQSISPSCTLVFNKAGNEKTFLPGLPVLQYEQTPSMKQRQVQPDATKRRWRVWYFTHLSYRQTWIKCAQAPTFWIPG